MTPTNEQHPRRDAPGPNSGATGSTKSRPTKAEVEARVAEMMASQGLPRPILIRCAGGDPEHPLLLTFQLEGTPMLIEIDTTVM